MSLLFETIKYQDKRFHNIEYHQKRMDEAFELFLNAKNPFKLEELLENNQPVTNSTHRCRISYYLTGYSIEFIPYTIRKIHSLKIIKNNDIDYSFKYEDRNQLIELLNQKGDADEIVICKSGYLTDSSYSNIILHKDGIWYTPDTYLLNGTKRQYLLNSGIIKEKAIHLDDLEQYDSISLINAMLEPGQVQLPLSSVLL